MSDERLIDEAVLRRALRLEADERPPRLDAAALRAAAVRDPALTWWPLAAVAIAIAALGVSVAFVRAAADVAALILSGAALDLAVAILGFVAVPLQLAWGIFSQPSVPLAILAAVVIAILYERRLDGRESSVRAS